MSLNLDTLGQRIVGVLIEKELTVPDSYPLTLNALLAGCNQKNNRDPQMSVEDFDVEGALRALMDSSWVTRREPVTGRTMRYAHETRRQLGVEKPDLAILSELLCRGPQAPGALKTRTARMVRFASPQDVLARLQTMAAMPVPFVTQLPKAPREKDRRWCHLLDGRSPEEARAAFESASPSSRSASVVSAPVGSRSADMLARIEALEAAVAELRERLGS